MVVVSEERGKVSLVEGGRISKDMETEELREALHKHLKKRKQKGLIFEKA